MKPIRYADNRYQHGYKPAAQTDIRKTFARVRAEHKAATAAKESEEKRLAEEAARDEAERQRVVAPLRKAKP